MIFAEAVAALRAPALVSNDQLQYVAVNDAAATFLGYDREALLELRVNEIVEKPREYLVGETQKLERSLYRAGSTGVHRRKGDLVPVNFVSLRTDIAKLPHVLTLLGTPPS